MKRLLGIALLISSISMVNAFDFIGNTIEGVAEGTADVVEGAGNIAAAPFRAADRAYHNDDRGTFYVDNGSRIYVDEEPVYSTDDSVVVVD
jgi:hypothetical protein